MNKKRNSETTATADKQCDRISAVRVIIQIMKFLGLWQWKEVKQSNEKEFSRYHVLEYIQRIFIHIPISFTYVTLLWVEVFTSTNLDEAGDVLYMGVTQFTILVKILNFWHYLDKAWNFINELTHSNTYELLNLEEVEYWQLKQKQFRNVIGIFMCGSILAILGGSVGVLFVDENQLPFAYWVPFEWHTNTRNYRIAYWYNVIGVYVTAISNVCVDTMACYFMFHIGLLYKVLGLRLARLKATRNEDIFTELRQIFIFHENVKRMTKDCESLISTFFFSQITSSALILCFSGYRMQKMNIVQDVGSFYFMMQFLWIMILELFLPCYCGNEITMNSAELCTQLYSSDWLKFSIPTRKLINLHMEFLKHPETVKAWGFFVVGLPIFTAVMNKAFSFYALLVNVQN